MHNAHVLAFYRHLAIQMKFKSGPAFLIALDAWEHELDNTLIYTNSTRRSMGLPEVLYKANHACAH